MKNKIFDEMKKINEAKFGFQNHKDSVHGMELPKFSDKMDPVQWWSKNQELKETVSTVSQRKLLQDRKHWAKNDELYLSEVNGQQPPEDPFKKQRKILIQSKIEEKIAEKPTNKPISNLITFGRPMKPRFGT